MGAAFAPINGTFTSVVKPARRRSAGVRREMIGNIARCWRLGGVLGKPGKGRRRFETEGAPKNTTPQAAKNKEATGNPELSGEGWRNRRPPQMNRRAPSISPAKPAPGASSR
jgi:hypothetical protein